MFGRYKSMDEKQLDQIQLEKESYDADWKKKALWGSCWSYDLTSSWWFFVLQLQGGMWSLDSLGILDVQTRAVASNAIFYLWLTGKLCPFLLEALAKVTLAFFTPKLDFCNALYLLNTQKPAF